MDYCNDSLPTIARKRFGQWQQGSKKTMSLGSISTLLAVMTIFLASSVNAESTSIRSIPSMQTLFPQEHVEERYGRKVLEDDEEDYWECDDDYEDECYDEDECESCDEDEREFDLYEDKWTQEQIDQMERYYQRYLEVFFQKVGDGYEPEDKETVYSEFLAYRERHSKSKPEKSRVNITKHNTRNIDDREITLLESHKAQASHISDSIIVDQDPYYLEIDWAEFNEGVEDLYSPPKNYTEAIITTVSPTTIVVVGRTYESSDASATILQPLSAPARPIYL